MLMGLTTGLPTPEDVGQCTPRVCLPELCGHPAGVSLAVGGHPGAEETSSCPLGLRAKAS